MRAVSGMVRGLALAGAMAVAASTATAQSGSWAGYMNGATEVPANGSTATGYTLVTLMGNMLTVNASWSGLTGGPAAMGHIHCCTPIGNNVTVAVPFVGLPMTVSGSYTNTFDLTLVGTYNATFLANFGGGTAAGAEAALIAGLNAGQAYSNIHNRVYPGGEIRADLHTTPEPGTVGLMATGLVSLAGLGWRRRRSV